METEQQESVFTIEKAVRKGTPALIALWGGSSSGKTFSALRIARGLCGPKGKIGVIDTENRRAEFYADEVNGWHHLDFQPPFTPNRYTQAIDACISADCDVIIVDSMSHVWEGEGGVLDMADTNKKKGAQKWAAPKLAYKRMLNHLLRAPCHVIFCLRAKDGMDWSNQSDPKQTGLTPICGKGFIYEMTVSVLLYNAVPMFKDINGVVQCDPRIPPVKAPKYLWPVIKPEQHLSEDTGKGIAAWIGSGAPFDFDLAKLQREARDLATLGTERMKQWWSGLSKDERKSLLPIHEELKRLAAQADQEDIPVENENHDNDYHDGDADISFLDDDVPGVETPVMDTESDDGAWPGPDVPLPTDEEQAHETAS